MDGKHKYYEQAYRAHTGTSFYPEKRAVDYCAAFDATIKEGREKAQLLGGNPDHFENGYTRLWLAWMAAKGRCISTMITGGSNFPVDRARKANLSEHKRGEELTTFHENFFNRLEKANYRAYRATIDPIEELRGKLKEAQELQDMMKDANKILRSKKSDEVKNEELKAVLTNDEAKKDFIRFGGFRQFQLTNNNANIKRMAERLAHLEKKAALETKEVVRDGGIRIVQNIEADRIQIFYPDKPDYETREKLKKNAFKWSPTNECWQRQLTNNAINALKELGLN
jgi:hypothetical protein